MQNYELEMDLVTAHQLLRKTCITATRRVCLEPRDYVFALHDLYRHLAGHDTCLELVQVDYSRTVAEIYRDATRFMLEANDDWILSQVHHRDHADIITQGFPSWCAKWNRAANLEVDMSTPPTQCGGGPLTESLQISRTTLFVKPSTVAPDLLSIKCSRLGKIQSIATRPTAAELWEPEGVRRLLKATHQMAAHYFTTLQDSEIALIAKSYVVVGEYEAALRLAANSPSTTLHTIVCVLVLACLLTRDSRSFDTQSIGTIRDTMYGLAKLIKHLHDFGSIPTRSERLYLAGGFYRLLSIHTGNRPFYHMDTGYVGSGHLLLQEDDVIVILQGDLILYILRPTDDGNYHLVGPAYIFGFESGGFLDVKPEYDWITIC